MMYYREMQSSTPQGVRTYNSREQALAVKYGGQVSPSVEINMPVFERHFVLEAGWVPRAGLYHPTLDWIILSGAGREIVLQATDCNIKRIDSLEIGEIVKVCLIDPEIKLSIGGGWAVGDVLTNSGIPLYLSPGLPRFKDLF